MLSHSAAQLVIGEPEMAGRRLLVVAVGAQGLLDEPLFHFRHGGAEVDRRDRELPMNYVLMAIIAGIVPLFLLYQSVTGDLVIGGSMALVMLVAGFLFSAVAGYMAGLVGSSNNPISGVTIATILFASLLLYALMGSEAGVEGAASAILIGAVVCCAAGSGESRQGR